MGSYYFIAESGLKKEHEEEVEIYRLNNSRLQRIREKLAPTRIKIAEIFAVKISEKNNENFKKELYSLLTICSSPFVRSNICIVDKDLKKTIEELVFQQTDGKVTALFDKEDVLVNKGGKLIQGNKMVLKPTHETKK